MRKIPLVALFVIAGCNTVPEKADFQTVLKGNYKAIADCATPGFRAQPDWTRTDLDTMQKVEFSRGASGAVTGIITVEPAGPGMTKITSRVQRAIYGDDYYANIHRPIFEACARKT